VPEHWKVLNGLLSDIDLPLRDEMLRRLGKQNPSPSDRKRACDYLIERAPEDLEQVKKCVEALWIYDDKCFRSAYRPHGLLRTELGRVRSVAEAQEKVHRTVNTTDALGEILGLRVKHHVARSGKELDRTTLKTTITDAEEDRTIKMTIDGEMADLQLKWIRHSDDTLEFVHIHCMKDWEASNWSKTSGLAIEQFYELKQNEDTWLVRCRTCGRTWSSAGTTD
jgi:hypothetical protein